MSISESSAVRNNRYTLLLFRISAQKSSPLLSGRFTSLMIRSGLTASKSASASPTEKAEYTSYPSFFNFNEIPWFRFRSSSKSKIFCITPRLLYCCLYRSLYNRSLLCVNQTPPRIFERFIKNSSSQHSLPCQPHAHRRLHSATDRYKSLSRQ